MLDIAISEQALQWRGAGHGVAVAVVLSTWGSAPRPVGARLFVRDDGEFAGSVSGGCIEGAVITAAAEVMQNGTAQRLEFGVADETAWEVGLSCGGQIAVLVHPLNDNAAACLSTALQHIAQRQESALITRLDDGSQALHNGEGKTLVGDIEHSGDIGGDIGADIGGERDNFFIEQLPPQPRLLIVGATHITQFLLPLARPLAFDCVVMDPREHWATPARFPDTPLLVQWPDDALAQTKIGAHDAVVTLTHDPKIDDPALLAALTVAAAPFYIGALGSRRTHDKRLERLVAAGINSADCARIHAPIGLDLGAKSAAEIALSIMAQVLGEYRRGGTQ